MNIASITGFGFAPSPRAEGDPALLFARAPDHVDSVLWSVSSPDERAALLQGDAN